MSSEQLKMRRGYTTGTCAAAAAKAAACMLLTGSRTDSVHLHWQSEKGHGVEADFAVEDAAIGRNEARCAVRKDAGDDIDVTDGLRIYAKVSRADDPSNADETQIAASENTGKSEYDDNSNNCGDTEIVAAATNRLPGEARDSSEPLVLKTSKEADSGQETNNEVVVLSDLEDENGIIPMRWDKAADFFQSDSQGPKLHEQKPNGSEPDQRRGGRFISLADDGTFSASEWALIQGLFHSAGEQTIQGAPDLADNRILPDQERFLICGGEGIGTVTKPGLDQPPGEAAINSGPRRIIREAVSSVCDECEYEGRLLIEIFAPGGEELASRTFNPRLGIEGGISILGTTGIVEPMSGRAVVETVRAEVRVKASASEFLALVPGNTGAAYVNGEMMIPEEQTVIMSNYPGEALDEARNAGVKRILLTGSLGKMIRLAGGVFYTHSRDADARMDILMRCAIKAGASIGVLRGLDDCITTEAGLALLAQHGLLERTAEVILDRAVTYARHRAEDLRVEMVILRNSGEALAFTDEAFSIMMEEEDA